MIRMRMNHPKKQYVPNVIQHKRKKELEKKRRLNVLYLRNKFLAEWASSILRLDDNKKRKYIKKVTSREFKKDDNKYVVKEIEKDFANNNIKISFNEIELKIKDFQIKANIIEENKLKLNSMHQSVK